VGRLDFQSEGLVLLTNDGELAFKVSHPTHGSVKTYHVKVRGVPDDRIVDKLQRGITIEGKRTLPCEIARMKTTGKRDDEGNSWFEVKLREGRTQQIRKMFKAMGHPVSKLKRVAIGPISDPKLTAGVWRELTKQEVKMLATMQDAKPAKQRRTTTRSTATTATARRAAAKKPPQPRAKSAAGSKKKAAAGGKAPARRTASSSTKTNKPGRRASSPTAAAERKASRTRAARR